MHALLNILRYPAVEMCPYKQDGNGEWYRALKRDRILTEVHAYVRYPSYDILRVMIRVMKVADKRTRMAIWTNTVHLTN
jgi:hypothetical protein